VDECKPLFHGGGTTYYHEFGEIDDETRAAVLGAADAVGGPRADRRTRAPTQREMVGPGGIRLLFCRNSLC
jgi:hypothetical protein